jgi:predicted TPR repeat methyltransferase
VREFRRSYDHLIHIPYVCVPICEELAKLSPTESSSWHDLASAYQEAGQFEKSAHAFSRYSELKPPDNQALDDEDFDIG